MLIYDENGCIIGETSTDDLPVDPEEPPTCTVCGKPIEGHVYYTARGIHCESCFRKPPPARKSGLSCIRK